MERPSSRADMHPDKEGRRTQVNGGTKSKHKIKSPLKLSYNSLLNNNRSHRQHFDRNLNCSDPYMGMSVGSYGPIMNMNPILHQSRPSYLPVPLYSDGPTSYHHAMSATEPTSLPVYPMHISGRLPIRAKAPAWEVWAPSYAPYRAPELNKTCIKHTNPWSHNDEDFTSLPPTVNDIKPQGSTVRPGQRRFSDPGVTIPSTTTVPDVSSEAGSGSSSSSDDSEHQSGVMQRMLMEMNTLRETNLRLMRELEYTRAQLEMLRSQQTANWHRMGSEYQPGMLADMVREVREATRIREEAMLSRLRHASSLDLDPSPLLLENTLQQRRVAEALHQQRLQSTSQQSRHSDDRRRRRRQHGSLARASSEDDDVGSSVSENSSRRSVDVSLLAGQVHQLKLDKQQLADELRQARDSRGETDVHVQKLERLVGILRKKITAMNGVHEHAAGQSSAFPTEPAFGVHSSLTSSPSSSAGSSLDPTVVSIPFPVVSPQMTIHGPVTNL